jgi:hypothetical protein
MPRRQNHLSHVEDLAAQIEALSEADGEQLISRLFAGSGWLGDRLRQHVEVIFGLHRSLVKERQKGSAQRAKHVKAIKILSQEVMRFAAESGEAQRTLQIGLNKYQAGPQVRAHRRLCRYEIIRSDIDQGMADAAIITHLRREHSDLIRKGDQLVKNATLLREIAAVRRQAAQNCNPAADLQ